MIRLQSMRARKTTHPDFKFCVILDRNIVGFFNKVEGGYALFNRQELLIGVFKTITKLKIGTLKSEGIYVQSNLERRG